MPYADFNCPVRNVPVDKCLALSTKDYKVSSLNPIGDIIQVITVWLCIAKSLSLSSFQCLDMTKINQC